MLCVSEPPGDGPLNGVPVSPVSECHQIKYTTPDGEEVSPAQVQVRPANKTTLGDLLN